MILIKNLIKERKPFLEIKDKFIGAGSVKWFSFECVYKSDRWRVYKVNDDHYEWFERRAYSVKSFASFVNNNYLDNKPEFKELYPKDEDFGFNAFTGNKCPDFNYLENLSHNV